MKRLTQSQRDHISAVEPRYYKYQLRALREALKDVCSVHVTGHNLLTFDASMDHRDRNAAFEAAKWASISQVVLFHGQGGVTTLLWNGRAIGKV